MIKFTIIFVIVYFVLYYLTKWYVDGMNILDKYMLAKGYYGTKKRYVWFAFLSLMRYLSIIFAAISAILLVVRYL